MSKATEKLIKLVESKAGELDSSSKAQKYLQEGADITARTKIGSMIHSVIDGEKRLRPVLPQKADCCLCLIQILQDAASARLAAQVFSQNGGDLNVMRQLVELKANCYQSSKYGPLGMLGSLLQQGDIPIRVDVVQFLIDSDPETKYSLTTIDHQQKTCLSIAKSNCKNCPKDVIDYVQRQVDHILNQIPFTNPRISPNEMIAWIHRGANIEAIDSQCNTVLCNAVIANNLELVRALLIAGSKTGHRNKDDLTPLGIAERATTKNHILISILKDQDVNAELKRLIETRKSQLTFDEVDVLLKKGAKINATFADNNSLLHLLIANHGTPEMIATFVNDFNADISIMNTNAYRPIETCILVDREPFTSLSTFLKLSKTNTDLFKNSKLNKNLLQFAKEQQRLGAEKIIQNELNLRLWNCMARANTNDDNNKYIMTEMNELINCGAQINHKQDNEEYQKWTVLHLACKNTTGRLVEYLIINLQADYAIQNHHGDYPVSIAAEHGHLSIIEYLRSLPNSSLNVFNKERQTPLHLATKHHHLCVVQYLVRWGADPTAQNQSNQTPLDMARVNVSKSKEDEMSDKKLISFLEQLICPPVGDVSQTSSPTTILIGDLDICELAKPIVVHPIQMTTTHEDVILGGGRKNIFTLCPNDQLHEAAKDGLFETAKKAIGKGADIRHRKQNRNPYEVAQRSAETYYSKLISTMLDPKERARLDSLLNGCRQIIDMIRNLAHKKVFEAINQSDAGLVMGYHLAGAPLTVDFLKQACGAHDNVEIVDYLIQQSPDIYQALITDSSSNSPYSIAKARHFNNVANYIKYHLSLKCTNAVKENNFETIQKLVRAGASVDMHDTNNLNEALRHGNIAMIQFLCDNGAKIPSQWLNTDSIVLEPNLRQQFKSERIVQILNQCIIHRRLRFAAASGDMATLVKCQRLGADINSSNCHGSTALLCSLEHGNYFRIVHALISCGASVLHSNVNEPRSLIDIAKSKGYKKIDRYLSRELNTQFLLAIIGNDLESAQKYAELGAEFNYQDEQKRTALHYAIQYRGVELVRWLCERGCDPTISDSNGDCPIIQATEKGDYAMVKLFVTKYPTTKSLTNIDGLTALQTAQKLKFTRIAKLIETGKDVPESLKDSETADDKVKHDRNTLIEACQNGRIKIIQEFIEELYDSREEKRQLCYELIHVAEKANSFQIVELLNAHYQVLKTQPLPYMVQGSFVKLGESHKKVLYACLSGLSTLIANSPTKLDPDDPNTYMNLFSHLIGNTEKRSQELRQATSEQDVKRLIEDDATDTSNQLNAMKEKLEEYCGSKDCLQDRVLEIEKNLFQQGDLLAFQKKELAKEREDCKKQLAVFEYSISFIQRQQETMLNRQKAINFIKGSINLAVFYRIIEGRLQLLFAKILKYQSGYSGKAATSHLISEAIVSMKEVLGPLLLRLNRKVSKKEYCDISKLGNIKELDRIATETAGLITLYYREQIEIIDPMQIIRVGTVFNEKIGWLKHIFDVRPEISEEKIIIFVADYITAWIIDGLTAGKDEIISIGSLSQQLWLHVAKNDPLNHRYLIKSCNIVAPKAGQQIIPIKIKKPTGVPRKENVQLQHLFGYVSVLGSDGNVYQCSPPSNPSNLTIHDFEIFGFVFVQPFSSDKKVLESIIEGRKLLRVKQGVDGNILTKFDDIIQYAQTFIAQNDQSIDPSSTIANTADQVAKILCQQNVFVNLDVLDEEIKKAQDTIESDINELHEHIDKNIQYYQLSIQTAHEQIEKESKTNREEMKKNNEILYKQAMQHLNEQFQEMEKRLEQVIEKRMNKIANDMQQKVHEIHELTMMAENQSRQAIERANQAVEISEQAVQKAKQSATTAQNSESMIQQQRSELESLAKNLEIAVKQTAAEQKQLFENAISVTSAKVQQNFERAQEAVQKSAENAKVSAQTAKSSLSSIKDVQKVTEQQFDLQREESKKVNSAAKETQHRSERAAADAREAEEMLKRTVEVVNKTLDKMNRLHEKVEKALKQIEKS